MIDEGNACHKAPVRWHRTDGLPVPMRDVCHLQACGAVCDVPFRVSGFLVCRNSNDASSGAIFPCILCTVHAIGTSPEGPASASWLFGLALRMQRTMSA